MLNYGTEANKALRYKLIIRGVEIYGPTDVFSENNSLVLNASMPGSTLKKRHNPITYHASRWAVAAKDMKV